ncbi:MAG: LysE family transporter [Oligoflexia bacterium]|nr:LysE family transporter [Oligoflexia bacterium]
MEYFNVFYRRLGNPDAYARPDNIFVLTESLAKGHRNGLAVSAGLACGITIHTLAAVTGLSIIIQKSAPAYGY